MSIKQILGKVMAIASPIEAKNDLLGKIFLAEEHQSKLEKITSKDRGKGKADLVQMRIKKIVRIDRNPPSPYSIERFYGNVYFEVMEQENLRVFLKRYNQIMSAQDEDEFIKSYTKKLVNSTLRKYLEDSKEKVIYYTPCTLVQLFEKFHGFLVVKATRMIEFVPVVNVTKDVHIKIPIMEVKYVNDHRYMFQHTGLEIFVYFSNESFLLVFEDNATRATIKEIVVCNAPKILEMHLDVITKMWMNGYLSNYDYLIYLNRFSSRSFNDISQYPIFPWVISEFNDDEFKMNEKGYYRNLSKPIGSLNKNRFQRVLEVYEKMKKDKCKPYPSHHYNSFYSTPGYIVFFYMRSIPELILKLQNGPFGPSERIFKSLESLWITIHSTGANLTELIPEFYTPNKADFLLNTFNLDLGYSPEGDEIDDVILPKWAEDLQDMMFIMRAALESEFVSLSLHKWIDLVFGHKQKGREAEKSHNLYYHLCYEENVDWSIYNNPYHKKSLEIQMAEYGQVPIQLFEHPHPKKKIKIPVSLTYPVKQKNEEQVQNLMEKLEASNQEIARLKSNLSNLNQAYKKSMRDTEGDERDSELDGLGDLLRKEEHLLESKDMDIDRIEYNPEKDNKKWFNDEEISSDFDFDPDFLRKN